ncbi:glycerophosphodiester phosphodiesterase domain-containing protein 5-like isoform X1 [Anolis sagrei]|uniref:glycerophosphodiester phosphodiesterase domain-containing protein 5-like isoform X1 n=1 Tax=Anolis sagrei TaxID=38937 RepID=UPI0035203C9B
MEDGPITIKKTRRVKPKGHFRFQAQNYENEPLVSCLSGFYSGRWKRYERNRVRPGKSCCNVAEGIFLLLLITTFSLWLVFTYLWSQTKNDYYAFDEYSFDNMGFWFQWSVFLLIICSFILSYLSFLMILAMCLLTNTQQLYLHWIHKMGTLSTFGVAITAFIIIQTLWSSQWTTVYLSFQISAPFFHFFSILVMIFLAWPVGKHFFQVENKVLQGFILTPYLAVLLFLFFIPLGMHSPCIREEGTLGPKPKFIAHRGTPQMAPENTEMSFRKSLEFGVVGLETDVRISYDGVPFLMHDRTLKRTTNIDAMYPDMADVDASMLTWSKLQELNAGDWFFERRPFLYMPTLSPEEEKLVRNQKIFKFTDFLNLADQENKRVIFDLYRPPRSHPYSANYINVTLQAILHDSQIRHNLVLWLPELNRSYIQSVAPDFEYSSSRMRSVKDLKRKNISHLNVNYRNLRHMNIREYEEANITVNLWVINEPWLFSLAWCYGVHSVTTNRAHIMHDLEEPLFLMTPQNFMRMWMVTDALAVVLIGLLFGMHWWREVGAYCCEAESDESLEEGTCNKFGREVGGLSTVIEESETTIVG